MQSLNQETANSRTEREQLRDKLISEESLKGTVIGGSIGAIPGFILYAGLIYANVVPLVAYVAPGFFVGYGARFLGRGIHPRHGRAAAAVVMCFLVATWWYLGLDAFALLFSLTNAIIAALIAPRKLTTEQGGAVYDYRIGRWPT